MTGVPTGTPSPRPTSLPLKYVQEVLADLPERLTMEGMPAGCDPEIADIGYNHGHQVIVLHYSKIGYWPGTAVLGHMDVDVSILKNWAGPRTATIERTD